MPLSKSSSNSLAIPAIIGGVVLLTHSLRNFIKARKIQDTARIDIGSAPQGLVELEGYAWPKEHSMEAVCGRQAVYYAYQIDEHVKRGKNSTWETRFKFSFEHPFYVMDHSGICLVKPVEQCLELKQTTTRLSRYVTSVADLKTAKGPSGMLWGSTGRYRLVEKKILVGSPVYVNGDMSSAGYADYQISGDYKKFLQTVTAAKKNPIFHLQKFDKNRDGKVSEDELHDGHFELSKQDAVSKISSKIKIAGVIANSDNHAMILADCHEEQLVQKYTRFNYLKMAAGIGLILLGIYDLQRYLPFKKF